MLKTQICVTLPHCVKYRYYECYNVRIFLDPLHTRSPNTLILNLLEYNRTNFYCRFSVLVVVIVVLGLGLQELNRITFIRLKRSGYNLKILYIFHGDKFEIILEL